MTRALQADWTMISIWGWTLLTVVVVLATALLALIILAIRYLLRRMEREAAESKQPRTQPLASKGPVPHHGTVVPEVTENRDHVTNPRKTTRDPSPVPPENPHAPPSSSAELTRPGY